jgi:hypothetical protein
MRTKTPLALLAALASALVLGAGGCKQDVGERCEQNSDCASGVCSPGANVQRPGSCCPSGGCAGNETQDSGTSPTDSGSRPSDASGDAMSTSDAPIEMDAPQTPLDGASD